MSNDEIISYLNNRVREQVETHVSTMKMGMEFSKLESLTGYVLRDFLRLAVDNFVTFDYVQGVILNGPGRNKAG